MRSTRLDSKPHLHPEFRRAAKGRCADQIEPVDAAAQLLEGPQLAAVLGLFHLLQNLIDLRGVRYFPGVDVCLHHGRVLFRHQWNLLAVAVHELPVDEDIAFLEVLQIRGGQVSDGLGSEGRGVFRVAHQ